MLFNATDATSVALYSIPYHNTYQYSRVAEDISFGGLGNLTAVLPMPDHVDSTQPPGAVGMFYTRLRVPKTPMLFKVGWSSASVLVGPVASV